ncbi:BglG family transcription antiterminator, partial [Liquorilactobacillus satsumensis]
LQRYHLQLTTSLKSGAQITGSERAIRLVLSDLLNSQPGISTILTSKLIGGNLLINQIRRVFLIEDVLFIKEKIISIFPGNNLVANDNYLQQVLILTLIWVTRVKNCHYVSNDNNLRNMPICSKSTRYVNEIIKYFGLEIEVKSEKAYLVFVVNCFENADIKMLDNWGKAQIISIALIEWVEKRLEFPFSQNESLFERVYRHVESMLRRLDQRIRVANPLKETVKESYLGVFRAVADFFSATKDEYHVTLSEDEIGYLVIYFSTAQTEVEQDQIYKYQVAIVCNYGMATGRLLAAKLEEHFKVEVVAVLSVNEISVLKTIPVSVVFKTIDVEITDIPNIKLNPILTETDFMIIKKFLKKNSKRLKYEKKALDSTRLFSDILDFLKNSNIEIEKKFVSNLQYIFHVNHLSINERKVQPMLKDLISDTQIQLQLTAENWEAAIRISAQPLLREGFIKPSYVEAMLESVERYGPYIVIGPSIALAHARPTDGVEKLGISITTLKKPINFGNSENDPVQIIFCLAAIDNYSHLNVMKSIVKLINNQNKIKKLSSISSISKFKETLFDENSN